MDPYGAHMMGPDGPRWGPYAFRLQSPALIKPGDVAWTAFFLQKSGVPGTARLQPGLLPELDRKDHVKLSLGVCPEG